jgi:hypothetical protein
MPRSMATRARVAAALLPALVSVGCGGDRPPTREVRVLAPPGLVGDVSSFERGTGCRVALRVYDEEEDIAAVADLRDADVVAEPAAPGLPAHDSVELVRITLDDGLVITVPKALAAAFRGRRRPAGRRRTAWVVREEGNNDACARRWLTYATIR